MLLIIFLQLLLNCTSSQPTHGKNSDFSNSLTTKKALKRPHSQISNIPTESKGSLFSFDNHTVLQSYFQLNLTATVARNIKGKSITFFSGSPSIIELIEDEEYLINLRWVNYAYDSKGKKKIKPTTYISLNSRLKLNGNFEKIKDSELFLDDNPEKEVVSSYSIGIEDIRLFLYNNQIYYIGSKSERNNSLPCSVCICSGIYNITNSIFKLNIDNVIIVSNNNSNEVQVVRKSLEKNWSFLIYRNRMSLVYKWYPLQIGVINYETKIMNLISIKDNISEYFKNARGSTPGFIRGNEIWFVLHKTQHGPKKYVNYVHFFAVFSLDMNLIRYSETLKLGGQLIEFCIGLIVKETKIILSYSLLDSESYISVYDINYINSLKWYANHNTTS